MRTISLLQKIRPLSLCTYRQQREKSREGDKKFIISASMKLFSLLKKNYRKHTSTSSFEIKMGCILEISNSYSTDPILLTRSLSLTAKETQILYKKS